MTLSGDDVGASLGQPDPRAEEDPMTGNEDEGDAGRSPDDPDGTGQDGGANERGQDGPGQDEATTHDDGDGDGDGGRDGGGTTNDPAGAGLQLSWHPSGGRGRSGWRSLRTGRVRLSARRGPRRRHLGGPPGARRSRHLRGSSRRAGGRLVRRYTRPPTRCALLRRLTRAGVRAQPNHVFFIDADAPAAAARTRPSRRASPCQPRLRQPRLRQPRLRQPRLRQPRVRQPRLRQPRLR